MIVTVCSAIKKDGAPCAAKPILESEYCMSHHPNSAEWRSKGGRNKSNIARAQGATALIKLAEFVLLEERLSKMEDQISDRYPETNQ